MGKYIFQALFTPEEGGGFSAEIPDFPGCFTYGETLEDAAAMAADAAKTYVASKILHGETVPKSSIQDTGKASLLIFFETDETYIVQGETVSAAEAARMLKVSAGRVTHMLDSGILDGYRRGRRTYVTVASIERRLATNPGAGRPKAQAAMV